MTPLRKANLQILLFLVVGALIMTAFWVYFIIAKEPIQP
jgi:hypothetical protein